MEETRIVAYTYAWQVYSGMKTARRLKDLAKTCFSLEIGSQTTDVQAMVKTYGNDWGQSPAVWDHSESYMWQSTGSTSFDFSDPAGNTDWVRLSTITCAQRQGVQTLVDDVLASPTLTIYDSGGIWPVARLRNAANGAVDGISAL